MTDHQQHHPITPPPELVQQWIAEIWHEGTPVQVAQSDLHLATCAAAWGADQELEACCEWLDYNCPSVGAHHLRNDRRPKPPSLKEQALALLDPSNTYGSITQEKEYRISVANAEIIRRALEALPDD